MAEKTKFRVFGYRTSSGFGSHLDVSVENGIVYVTGSQVPRGVYRLWMGSQAAFFALSIPALILSIVFWDWRWLVAGLGLLLLYWIVSAIGAVALWEFQYVMSFDRGGYPTFSFPTSKIKEIRVGKGWARHGLSLVLLPFIAGLNKTAEGRVVSFEAPKNETGDYGVYAFHLSIEDKPETLAKLLES